MVTDTMLPVSGSAGPKPAAELSPIRSIPGLKRAAVENIRISFPGILTREFERYLSTTSGLEGTVLQYIDLTGQWHDEEPLAVFRPCLTLAVDDMGRRWIAETHKSAGLPGPVWCIHQTPEVSVYVAQDIGEFLDVVQSHSIAGTITRWLKGVDEAAKCAWQHRGALAFHARQDCAQDKQVRQWLLQLPRDARVFDLRSPRFGTAWPYGAAGPAGQFHRCGRELIFAVSGFPAPSRWADYIGELAWRQPIPAPAVTASGPMRIRPAACSTPADSNNQRLCA